jgi:hypothetical protein
VWLSGSADFAGKTVQRVVDGFADPLFRLSINLYGAPAPALKDFVDYKQDWIPPSTFTPAEVYQRARETIST